MFHLLSNPAFQSDQETIMFEIRVVAVMRKRIGH